MRVMYAFEKKLTWFRMADFVGKTQQNHKDSLLELQNPRDAYVNGEGFLVGLNEMGTHSGLVMVGGHRSIQRELLHANLIPLIQATGDGLLYAYWGVENAKMWFDKNLTWLMITTGDFWAHGYPNEASLYEYGIKGTATPRALAEALKRMWPDYFKKG
jgi:hypothetical protein